MNSTNRWWRFFRGLVTRPRGICLHSESQAGRGSHSTYNELLVGEGYRFLFDQKVSPSSSRVYQQGCVPPTLSGDQCVDQRIRDKTTQLAPIYSGIGLGVYQGEAVVFLQMAVGEKRWLVSRLRFADLTLFPSSVQQDVALLSCLLYLGGTQSDLVKTGLQTQDGIELMRTHCPLVRSDNKSRTYAAEGNVNADQAMRDKEIFQNQSCQVCSIWQQLFPCNTQSNIEESEVQP